MGLNYHSICEAAFQNFHFCLEKVGVCEAASQKFSFCLEKVRVCEAASQTGEANADCFRHGVFSRSGVTNIGGERRLFISGLIVTTAYALTKTPNRGKDLWN